MKTIILKYKRIFTLLWLTGICITPVSSQEYTENRQISKTFKCSNNTTVEVSNKYGRIHVIPWNKDSVRFDVNLSIKASTIPRLKKTRDNIDFDFTATTYYITANTVFNSRYNTFFNDLKSITESFLPSANQVIIDYTIKVPKKAILKITNKYGDIYLDDLLGEVTVSLSNGDLKANNLHGKANIGIAFGDGNINYLNDAKINISYSDIRIRDAKNIYMESKSSNITIDKVMLYKIQSKRDKIHLGETNNLIGETYFSDIWVNQMKNDLNYNMKYGNLYIQTVLKSFSIININSEYTDLEIFFQRGASYNLDISHTPDVYMRLPKENADIKEKLVNAETKEMLTYGKIGTAETASKLKLSAMKKCNITIIHK